MRANWLCNRDRNMKCFHQYATHHHKLNYIERLETQGGRVFENDDGIGIMVCCYFSDLFTAHGRRDLTNIFSGINSHVFKGMNTFILTEFREEEIFLALNVMGPDKALSEDGLLALFYQTYWHIVGNEIVMPHCTDEGQSAFVSGSLIINNVFVVFEVLGSFQNVKEGSRAHSF
ncbi:hypothetical protein PVK06_021067 [Gossypium arboreum]|uniref:Reverse transcriptase n=1 Tax=Gossypium arboreum TaxID=29729 RepID=A0ABR0PP04_GOSAR|nr:hypothetical protein PVK06_021067 [Gossypium arboreum]